MAEVAEKTGALVQRLLGRRSSHAPVSVPTPSDLYSGPPTAEAYADLPDRVNGVRVERPAGCDPATLAYPRQMPSAPTLSPAAAVPSQKQPLSYHQSAFFRAEALHPDPEPWAFPAFLDNPDCRWLQALKRLYADPITFPASISPEAGLLLHGVVLNARPKVVVETGTFLGASAIWMAAALAETGGVLHCFDDFIPVKPGPWRPHEMKSGVLEFVTEHIAEAGLADHVVLHPGNSAFELRAWADTLSAEERVQIAYLDADHRPVGVCQDFWAVEPLVPTGGMIILHDTFPKVCGDEGPRYLLDRINSLGAGLYESVDLYLAPINYGMALARRVA